MTAGKSFLWIICFLPGCILAHDFSEGGCDLSLTQPCRTNISLCVPLENVQDGFIDCPDGSDEDCPEGSFICSDDSGCIDPQFLQDGVSDCNDDSDEECDEWQHECLCGLPRCIDLSKVGDGHLDCVEGSDELFIEKESYICPPDLLTGQELIRKKRQLEISQGRREAKGAITNYYSITSGITPAIGVLTSTVDSFINSGTTSEYLTLIRGTSIDGKYAQVTSFSSRTFFALPTKLKENQVDGLVSSVIRTTVTDGFTKTIVSRIYHTNIDGAYAQLVETETRGIFPTKTVDLNLVTILQGEELQGTFVSHPGSSLATLQFSHLEGSLNPEPIAQEIVTVTGTYGNFIKGDPVEPTTYSVFTGSYIKNHRTYMFFFGNSALPSGNHMHVEKGSKLDKGKVILDMEKNMKLIMPLKQASESDDMLVGEGMVDGHKLDGLFIENTDGVDIKGVLKQGGGDIKMLTVTIGGQPTSIMHPKSKEAESFLFDTDDNEVETSLLQGRRANILGDNSIRKGKEIHPTLPLPFDIPTFVIQEPNQNIADVLIKEKILKNYIHTESSASTDDKDNVVENIKKQFSIESFFGGSYLPTVTYYGFADFTTTIEDTVVVFTPNSKVNFVSNDLFPIKTSVKPRVIHTDNLFSQQLGQGKKHTFSTATTKILNTIDLYPSGLVSSIGGTVISDDVTTLFTTLVYGTYIEDQYAQVVRSTSSIFYLLSKPPMATSTKSGDIAFTRSPFFDHSVNENSRGKALIKNNAFDSLLGSIHQDNSIGRSISGESKNQKQIINAEEKREKLLKPSVPFKSTYTLYTTYITDGTTKVLTNYKTTVVPTKPISDAFTRHDHNANIQFSISSQSPSQENDFLFDLFGDDFSSRKEEKKKQSISEGDSSSEFLLASSLNPDKDINASIFPRTYYTTYTYFTTYHKSNSSSIESSLETITNIITDESQLKEYKSLTPIVPTYPVTYWTTYTYWTTLIKDNSSITTSSKKTISNVVHLTANEIHSVQSIKATPTVDVTTYYTTYTYYTTITKDESTSITSRLETKSNVVTETQQPLPAKLSSHAKPFGLLFDSSVTTIPVTSLKTGLLSTIRGSTVIEGVTTVFSTNVYGTIVDGLYVQIQSTTSEILDGTSTISSLGGKKTGVLIVNAGSIIEDDFTTHYTTQTIGTYVNGVYITKLLRAITVDGISRSDSEQSAAKTGLIREVIGSIIHGTKTTYYHSTILGTEFSGVYALKTESTSRFVSGPSIAFNVLSGASLNLEHSSSPSVDSTIHPTPVLFATGNINDNPTETKENEQQLVKEKSKNRLSFPFRPSSKKRTETLPFTRNSSFPKEEALSKVLVGSLQENEESTGKNTKAEGPKSEPARSFRFGNSQGEPIRRFRFQKQLQEPEAKAKSAEIKNITTTTPKQSDKKVPDNEEAEDIDSLDVFRQFRFGGNPSTTGTRSSLPFRRGSKPKPSTTPPKTATPKLRQPDSTTVKSDVLREKHVNVATQSDKPLVLLSSLEEKRKTSRHKKPDSPERKNPVRRPKPITARERPSRPQRPPRPAGSRPGVARRRPIIPALKQEESNIDPIYIQVDGSEISDEENPNIFFFIPDDEIYESLIRRKRQISDFGSRTFVREVRRSARNRESNFDELLSPSPTQNNKQPFTIANPRATHPRLGRVRPTLNLDRSDTTGTIASLQRSKSRNTVPHLPRGQGTRRTVPLGNIPGRGFRRPSSSDRFPISDRFNPDEETVTTPTFRRPSAVTQKNRGLARPPPNKTNPIQAFLERPKPQPKTMITDTISRDIGDIALVEDLTVTREVPVTTTIPLIEDGKTIEKQVITASYTTEVVRPEQITKTEINGLVKLLLSTVESKQKVTTLFIHPIKTTSVIYTPTVIEGIETSISHIVPTTVYSIVTVTGQRNGNDVKDLLKLLILQQQQQNPLLAALGLAGQPGLKILTSTFVTTVTSLTTTEIPIIFRGKPIRTVVVDTNTEIITTTKVVTQTMAGHLPPNTIANPNPLSQLLPFLLQNQLQRKARKIDVTKHEQSEDSFPVISFHAADIDDANSDQINEDIGEQVKSSLKLSGGKYIESTPPLLRSDTSKDETLGKHFLFENPAEQTPLRRKVRNVQRGNTLRGRRRFRDPGERKISPTEESQSIQRLIADEKETVNDEGSNNRITGGNNRPTTFYTTFTYYTTLIDEHDREFIQSSEETITKVSTTGNKEFDEFTRTPPSNLQAIDRTVDIHNKFTLEDAIIPGLPRPVPDPVFKDPDPPHGPVIRHDAVPNLNTRRRPVSRGRGNHGSRETIGRDHLRPNDVEDNKPQTRIGLTKSKSENLLNPDFEIIADQEHVGTVGKQKVVPPSKQPPIKVASPTHPFLGTVSTLYTVYSYIYSLYKNTDPFTVSTRLITVSNAVRPTLIEVPIQFQTINQSIHLYTIEEGSKIETLGERIKNGLTTQIYLKSATLADIQPTSLERQSVGLNHVHELLKDDNSVTNPQLESSFIESQSTKSIATPHFTRNLNKNTPKGSQITSSNTRRQQPRPSQVRSPQTSSDETTSSRARQTTSRSRPRPSRVRQSSSSTESISIFKSRRRQPQTSREITTKTSTTLPDIGDIDEEYTQIVRPQEDFVKLSHIFDNVFGNIEISTSGKNRSSDTTNAEKTTTTLKSVSEPSSTASRDEVSKVRKPISDDTDYSTVMESHKVEEDKSSFSTNKSEEFNYDLLESDYYYDDYYYDYADELLNGTLVQEKQSLHEKLKKENIISTKETDKGGRDISFNSHFDQLVDSSPVGNIGTNLKISGRQNLATKIMDNGVEVIVAEDHTLRKPSVPSFVRTPVSNFRRPITLPPSTLSNQMLLFAATPNNIKHLLTSPSEDESFFNVKTYYTTFTYYNTIVADGVPTVVSSKETISNIISSTYEFSGNFIERTKVQLETSTYLTSQTFTRTIGDFLNPQVITSEEVITQVVVTEAPSVTVSRIKVTPYTQFITKTYFTTFTYYRTYAEDTGIRVETETVISSDIVTETSTVNRYISSTVPPQIIFDGTPLEIYATKTYFTTSTYLTTILEGDEILTTSHTEITSNVVTEPLTTFLNSDDIMLYSSSLYEGIHASLHPLDEGIHEKSEYVSLGSQLYKELKTLFATYTHFTTLALGKVLSREVTKTKLLTSTITTTSVPASLLIQFDKTKSPTETTNINDFISAFDPSFFDSFLDYVALDPSYTETSTLSSNMHLKTSGLKATVHVQEGSDSGTFIVKDSTTSATLVVGPSDAAILLLATTAPPSNDLDIDPSIPSRPILSTRVNSPNLNSNPVPSSSSSSSSGTSSTADEKPENKLSFGFTPMLTAVAGLIGNTFVGKLASSAHGSKRKISEPFLPKNAIVAAEKEPLFIPVGGVGASLRSSYDQTLHPKHGFIPLNRHERPEQTWKLVLPSISEAQGLQPSVSLESFGPTFRPPLKTETGFTAMTKNIAPTRVSVISGEETIFFGGFKDVDVPQLDHVAEESQQVPIPVRLDEENEELLSYLSFAPNHPQEFSFKDVSPNIVRPTQKEKNVLEATVGIGKRPLTKVRDTTIMNPDRPYLLGNDGGRTTIVAGLSTLLSGTTTIFESLFTKPLESVKKSARPAENVERKTTIIVTKVETSPFTVVATKTRYDFIDGFPITRSEIVTQTKTLKTLVSTIVDSVTHINNIYPTSVTSDSIQSTVKAVSNFEISRATTTLFPKPALEDSTFYDHSVEYTEDTYNEANVEYEDKTEISSELKVIMLEKEIKEVTTEKPYKLCSSKCSSTEICKTITNEQVCVCKPGYSRKGHTESCEKSRSFQLAVNLEHMNGKRLAFHSKLMNSTNPETEFLKQEIKSGIEKALMDSDLSKTYHSNAVIDFDKYQEDEPTLVARVKVDLADDETKDAFLGGSFFPFKKGRMDEMSVKSALEEALRSSNYSLGGGEIYASRQAAIIAAEDFDECESDEYNDCDRNAKCINTLGSFTCLCEEPFIEANDKNKWPPGRQCYETNSCSYCNFHGICKLRGNKEIKCICNEWFSGEHCGINMKVMLIAVISVGSFLLLLLAICIVFCCCRSRRESQPVFLRNGGKGRQPTTLDRRAMIHDSSSECSDDIRRMNMEGKLGPIPRTPKVDYSVGRRSGQSSISKNRSVRVHTTLPSFIIPRIKSYGNNITTMYKECNARTNKVSPSAEATLIDILDGSPHPREMEPTATAHSYGMKPKSRSKSTSRERLDERSHHFKKSHHRSSEDSEDIIDSQGITSRSTSQLPRFSDEVPFRSRSTDRLDRSSQDLTSEFEANSVRYGNRTVSQARSYDETTVRPQIRELRGESFRSRDRNSQVISDGVPTNAERDGNSTIVYPQMQLYRPLRESDSMSDLTRNPKTDFD